MPNISILILLNFYFKLSTLTSQVDNTKNWKKFFSVSSKKYNFENLNKGRLAFQRNILNQIIYNHQIFPLICLLYLYTGVKAQLWRISRNIVSPYEHLNYPWPPCLYSYCVLSFPLPPFCQNNFGILVKLSLGNKFL